MLSSDDLLQPRNSYSGRHQPSMSYTLAKALVMIRVLANPASAQLMVCAQAPYSTEDARYQYTMAWRNSPFAADNIQVKKHQNTNILSSIDVESLDQTDQFVFEISKALGSAAALKKKSEAALLQVSNCNGGGGLLILANVHMDPGDEEDVRAKLARINLFVMAFVTKYADKCSDPHAPDAQLISRGACDEFRRIVREHKQYRRQPIQLKWTPPEVPSGHERPDCSQGVCYRALLPFMLNVSVADASAVSYPFALPNNSPVVVMDVSRGIAITPRFRASVGAS